MELYVKFVVALAFGLIGLGAVLKILLETIFNEWDAFNDLYRRVMLMCAHKVVHVQSIRAEDIMLDAEKRRTGGATARTSRLSDQRRRQIKEIDAVESRLSLTRS